MMEIHGRIFHGRLPWFSVWGSVNTAINRVSNNL